MDKTVFALQIENANDDGLVSLKKDIANNNDLDLYEKEGLFLVYPLGQKLTELLSTEGFDMGLESTSLKILDFNTETKAYSLDENLAKKIDEETDVVVEDGKFAMQGFDSILDFINENELEPEAHSRDSPTAVSTDEPIENEQTSESTEDGNSDFDNSDLEKEFNGIDTNTDDNNDPSVEPTEETTNSGSTETEVSENKQDTESYLSETTQEPAQNVEKRAQPEETDYTESEKSTNDQPKANVGTFFNGAFQDSGESEPSDKGQSSLVDIAENLFDSQEITTIPELDPDAPDSIKEIVTKAQNNIYQKKDEIVSNISQKLNKAIRISDQKLAENQIKKAQEDHKKVLRDIDSNVNLKKDDSEKRRKQTYEEEKEGYVQAQVSQIRRDYDVKHSDELNDLITGDYEQILDEADLSRDRENDQYEKYLKEAKDNSFKTVLRTIDIDPEIKSFRKYVQAQVDKIDSFTKEFNEYKNAMKKTLEDKDSALELLRKTSNEQSQLRIDRINAKNSIKLQRLNDSLTQTKKELERKNQQYEILKELHTEIKPVDKEKTVTKQVSNTSEPQEVTGEILKEQKKYDNRHSWLVPTAISTTVFAVVALIFALFMATRPVSTSQTTTQPPTQQVQTSTSNSASTPSKKLKKGDSFVYTKANGDQVKVIVDSPNSGHYIDGDGNSQTVIF